MKATRDGLDHSPWRRTWLDWVVLSAAVLLAPSMILLQCQRTLCSSTATYLRQTDLAPQMRSVAAGSQVEVWVDVQASGIYTPTSTGRLLSQSDGSLPSYLDELAARGYIAIRVPHAPPTYTPSSLVPGVSMNENAVEFRYYSPPDAAVATTVPVTVTRIPAYETIVNQRYPTDGHSHWEVWWIEGDRFPIPSAPFQLKAEWPQALEIMFRIDLGSGVDAFDCAGCAVEYLLYNGYTFIGPFHSVLNLEGAPSGNPAFAFDSHCDFATRLHDLEPGESFTDTHWLENYDALARTFTVDVSSAQDWPYTYYYGEEGQPLQAAPGLPFTVTVDAAPSGWPYAGCMRIVAVGAPTLGITDTMRETLIYSATSAVYPGVYAETFSVALAPAYELSEGIEYDFAVYLPLVMRGY